MVHRVHAVLTFCCATAAALSQTTDVAPWIEQLAKPAERNAAHAKLLELGAAAATPLAARIATADEDHARACLAVLDELGPAGGAAIPALVDLLRDDTRKPRFPCVLEALGTLAELIPYRQEDFDAEDLRRIGINFMVRNDNAVAVQAWSVALQRLRVRNQFPRRQALDALLALALDRHPWVAEAAIEQLGVLGPAAERAVPLLRGVLQRPEPRILPGEQRVPLHRRAARALLAIAPEGGDANAARAVMANRWTPPAPAARAVPDRARQRIAQLLVELADTDDARRAAAADNLVALGALAADPVATLLAPANAEATIAAAVAVLQRLGKDAATTVPSLVNALTELSSAHTIAVMQALAATLPWSEHVFVSPTGTTTVGNLTIDGHRIRGTIDVAFLNAFDVEMIALHLALTIRVDGSPEQLRPLLADPWVARRRRALEVIAARGSECSGLLDTIAPMLDETPPPEWVSERVDAQGMRTAKVDRTDQIQRLAATAILAIAPADHPLVAKARERLAQPVAK